MRDRCSLEIGKSLVEDTVGGGNTNDTSWPCFLTRFELSIGVGNMPSSSCALECGVVGSKTSRANSVNAEFMGVIVSFDCWVIFKDALFLDSTPCARRPQIRVVLVVLELDVRRAMR